MLKPALLHNGKNCTLCGLCAKNCPTGAVSVTEGTWKVDLTLCSACGRCAAECRCDALELSGQIYTVEEAAAEVLKDKAFFDKSEGGVTLSGGEVLVQVEFAERLARVLKNAGVHIACETTAALPAAVFDRLLAAVDYMMLDIKHYDAEKLWEVCHGDMRIISGNIKKAVKQGVPVVGRIPVIPGFNASMGDMEEFARFGKEMGIEEFHLLPFHQLGEEKYERLQKVYRMKSVPALHKEDLEEYAVCLRSCGFRVEIGG